MDLRITLKFIKGQEDDAPAVTLEPSNTLFPLEDPLFYANNIRETVLPICVPKDHACMVEFTRNTPIARVICETGDLTFEIEGKRLLVNLPAFDQSMDKVASLYTIIPFDGVELRVEQADEARRAGKYDSGQFPMAAHIASIQMEFALLEAIQLLGLDKSAGQSPCGPIWLMGFDTNAPFGHIDFPPHMHMHMAKPSFSAPVGHFFFDEQCLLTHNKVGFRGIGKKGFVLHKEEPFWHTTPDGTKLYEITITQDGGLRIREPGGECAVIKPIGSGFDQGAICECMGRQIHIKARPNATMGRLVVERNGVQTIYMSDPDTGRFLKSYQPDLNAMSG